MVSQSTSWGRGTHEGILEVLTNNVPTGVGASDRAAWHPAGAPLSVTARLWEAFYCFSNINQTTAWSWGLSDQPAPQSGRGVDSLGMAAWNQDAWGGPGPSSVPLLRNQHDGSHISRTSCVLDTSHPYSPFLI